MVCCIAPLLHPILVWGYGRTPSVVPDAFRTGALTAAMARGFNACIFANTFRHAKRVSASSVPLCTLNSALTVWVWLMLLESV